MIVVAIVQQRAEVKLERGKNTYKNYNVLA